MTPHRLVPRLISWSQPGSAAGRVLSLVQALRLPEEDTASPSGPSGRHDSGGRRHDPALDPVALANLAALNAALDEVRRHADQTWSGARCGDAPSGPGHPGLVDGVGTSASHASVPLDGGDGERRGATDTDGPEVRDAVAHHGATPVAATGDTTTDGLALHRIVAAQTAFSARMVAGFTTLASQFATSRVDDRPTLATSPPQGGAGAHGVAGSGRPSW